MYGEEMGERGEVLGVATAEGMRMGGLGDGISCEVRGWGDGGGKKWIVWIRAVVFCGLSRS